VDERRDARIADAFKTGTPIEGKSTIKIAFVALQSGTQLGQPLSHVESKLGLIEVYDVDTGRTHLLENHGNFL